MNNDNTYHFEITDNFVYLVENNGKHGMSYGKRLSVDEAKHKLISERERRTAHHSFIQEIDEMSVEEFIGSKHFAYARHKEHGVSLYARSEWSPTGVERVKGLSHEEAKVLLKGRNSPLSPSEELRTAR